MPMFRCMICQAEVSARYGTQDSEKMRDEGRENILRWFCNPELGGSKDPAGSHIEV